MFSPFYVSMGSFFAGIALASLFHVSIYVPIVLLLCACGILVFPANFTYRKCLVVFLLAISLGIFRLEYADFSLNQDRIDALLERQVVMTGVIDKEPSEGVTTTEVVVRAEETRATVFEGDGNPEEILESRKQPRVIFSVPIYSQFKYGDEVQVTGRLIDPQPIVDDDGGSFDYPSYLLLSGIEYEVQYPKVTLLAQEKGNVFITFLLNLKKDFISNLDGVLPEPESALMAGILLGEKRSLGTDIEDEFRAAGVIHVVILAGYTITLVATSVTGFFESIFSFLSPRWAIGAGALGIIFFALITGGSATILRASIMALLVLGARFFRRDYDVNRALFLASFLIIFYEPRTLIFDASFQTSFIAVFGLIHFSPILARTRFMQMLPEKWKFREIVLSTLATQIFSLPFLIYQVGQVSVVGVIANLLILGLVPATMLSGFVAGLAGFVSQGFGIFVAAVPYALLRYELAVVSFFGQLSFASVNVAHFSLLDMMLCYVVYAAIYFWFFRQKIKPR